MEEMIQSVLQKEIADQIDDGTKKKTMDKILGDKDLLFQWCFVVRTVVDVEHSSHCKRHCICEFLSRITSKRCKRKKGLCTKLVSSN